MKFIVKDVMKNKDFNLVYRESDFSFDIEPLRNSGQSSVMINDLQLEMTHQGEILYVWGLCPLTESKQIDTFPQYYEHKAIFAILQKNPSIGISYRLNQQKRWPVFINSQKEWICVGDPELSERQLIEFAPKCVAAMKAQEIVAIWLKPLTFPKI